MSKKMSSIPNSIALNTPSAGLISTNVSKRARRVAYLAPQTDTRSIGRKRTFFRQLQVSVGVSLPPPVHASCLPVAGKGGF